MENQLKDYLHLYLGCQYRYRYVDYQTDQWVVWVTLTPERLYKVLNDHSISEIQIAVRKLSSMTGEEINHLCTLNDSWLPCVFDPSVREHNLSIVEPEVFRFLLSKHFDLFGLIESGLAIDSETIHLNESLKG